MAASLIPSGPVHRWLRDEVVPEYGSLRCLARVLGERSSTPAPSWYRLLVRLGHQPTLRLATADVLCSLLGEHVSRFDPAYMEAHFHDFDSCNNSSAS